jgi:hypothetical protein
MLRIERGFHWKGLRWKDNLEIILEKAESNTKSKLTCGNHIIFTYRIVEIGNQNSFLGSSQKYSTF